MARFWAVAALLVLGTAFVCPAGAAQIIYYDDGATQPVMAIDRANIVGADMAGMTVTVSGRDKDDVAFSDMGVLVAGVDMGYVAFSDSGYDFQLQEKGDTYDDHWTLVNGMDELLTINSITFDGFPGNVVFDSIYDGVEGTPGSGLGVFTTVVNGVNPAYIATYMDHVAVDGNPPVGDIYRSLDVTLDQTFSGSGSYDLFTADTDRIKPIPEPASLLLVGTALIGFVGVRMRRRFH